jgi:WD40 repeat protein/tetratricopeptide (TPR) repeat protein
MKKYSGLFPQNYSKVNEKIMKINQPNPLFGEELYTLTNHTGGVRTVVFSPDGRYLASGGGDLLIKVWNVADGDELYTLRGHTKGIENLAFSPDNMFLASSSIDSTIKIWNVTNGEELQTLTGHIGFISSLAFSRQAVELVSGDYTGLFKVWKWNSTYWEEKRSLSAHNGGIMYVHYSIDGTLAVTSGLEDKTIRIWNTTSWKEIRTFTGHTNYVLETKFSPDGTKLASATSDSDIWLWDLSSGTPTSLPGHTILYTKQNWGGSIDFSPNGMILASGGRDGLVKLWNVTTGEQLEILSEHNDVIGRVIFSPDGTLIASCSYDSTITLWNIARGAKLETLSNHDSTVTSVEFSPDGTLLASASDDKTIVVWNATSGTDLLTLNNHTDGVNSASFSPDGSILASGSDDKTINLWNVTDGKVLQVLSNHTDWISSVDISPNGMRLASGAGDATVKLWNISNGVVMQTWYKHISDVTSVAFSPDSTKLATSSADNNVRLWDVVTITDESLLVLTDHTDDVSSVAFSPSGNVLASASYDKTIILWDVTSGERIKKIITMGRVQTVKFSPDGKFLASGTTDGIIQFWNVADGEMIKLYYLHKVGIRSIAFSPSGHIMVSGDTKSSIEFWDVFETPDFDNDGMPDDWEIESHLDPSKFYDKFDDMDNDGLPNSLELFLTTYPDNADSDDDSLPDGWEYLGGTNPLVEDANSDLIDGDGLPALYEFSMGLNPRFNDSALDKDNDGLTNLKEFKIGSWANQSDTDLDGMPDDYEYKYGEMKSPNPLVADAFKDPDRDGVTNINECKGGSNPRDFWSVPHFTISIPHVIVAVIILGLTIQTLVAYKRKLRRDLIQRMNAPDYATALKVRSSGLGNYAAFVQANIDAKELISEGTSYYYQGKLIEAIQQYEQAMTVFERLGDHLSKATTIFWIAQVQRERQELTADSSILKLFPQSPYNDPIFEAIDYMLQALLAEADKNWGLANESWQTALDFKKLDIKFSLICQRALLEFRVKNWMENPVREEQESLTSQLNELEEECRTTQHFGTLCQVFLMHAKVAFASVQFDEVENWLNQCSEIAEKNKLLIYQEAATKEKTILLRHKSKIQEEIDKRVSPEEQMKVLQNYIKEALDSLGKEGLI